MKDQFKDGSVVVDNAIGFWIHRVYQATRNEMYRVFRAAGEDVTPEQWAVLIRLWEKDGQPQSELSEATFRDAPTMSRIIDGLEARELLVRRAHPDDGRVRLVHLTRAGKALEKKLVPLAEKIVADLVEGIDERALVTTRNTLRKMFANFADRD
ncbi:MAG: MarR family winged helix-turn-helix transcriptional regulator [Kofleriaceae bacterium]